MREVHQAGPAHGLRALFVNVSFVIGDSLLRELGDDAEGVVVTQVVPPIDADVPAVRDYRDAVPAAERGFVSLEGFLAARAFVEGLRRAGPNATAEAFIDALETAGPMDLGLVTVTLSPPPGRLASETRPPDGEQPVAPARHRVAQRLGRGLEQLGEPPGLEPAALGEQLARRELP
ncbi:MAG TPA: ABC transporter substrate-binding protein [Kofleriaceae bacterium]|nr:ABC transporter substrate-binding protein [Kofleriaceae bacterium]